MARVTKHGGRRAVERLGIPKRSVERMADRALADGARHADFSGSMRRYLDGVFLRYGKANNMRVYNQHLFIFDHDNLITAWALPPRYRSAAIRACDRG